MIRLRTIICLLLLIHAGCQKTSKQSAFHGDLFTYAAKDDPEYASVWHGPIPSTHPQSVLLSDNFWQIHAQNNPSFTAEEMTKLRQSFSIRYAKSLTFHGHTVTKWTVTIGKEDSRAFKSLCSTYHKIRTGPFPEQESMETRRRALTKEYSDAKSAREKDPNLVSATKVEIARRNFNQVDQRLELMKRANETHGQIVRELMAFDLSTQG